MVETLAVQLTHLKIDGMVKKVQLALLLYNTLVHMSRQHVVLVSMVLTESATIVTLLEHSATK
jgi:hypothetical protein